MTRPQPSPGWSVLGTCLGRASRRSRTYHPREALGRAALALSLALQALDLLLSLALQALDLLLSLALQALDLLLSLALQALDLPLIPGLQARHGADPVVVADPLQRPQHDRRHGHRLVE